MYESTFESVNQREATIYTNMKGKSGHETKRQGPARKGNKVIKQ